VSLAGYVSGPLSGRLSGGGSDIPTPADTLGSLLILDYDPALGATLSGSDLDTLACQVTGHAIAKPGAGQLPPYTASDAAFNNKPTFTTSSAGNDCLVSPSAHGSPLVANGMRPYAAWVGSIPSVGGTNPAIWGLANPGNINRFALTQQSADSLLRLQVGGSGVGGTVAVDTASHLIEALPVGTDLTLLIDGVEVISAFPASAIADCTLVSLGCRTDGQRIKDATHARLIVASEAPSAGQLAALRTYFTATYGVP
jgi:hypothetical protein